MGRTVSKKKDYKTANDFSKGSIFGHMIRLAVPMTLAQLINVLYNIVDRIYIGMIPENSTLALTGIGVCFPLCTIAIAFANLIGMGGAPLFSIERGAGEEKEAEAILGNSFVMLIGFGLFLSVIGYALKEPALYLLGASDATFGYADAYMSIYLIGTVFVTLSLGLNSFINAQGFAKTGMMTVTIGAVLNVFLDPLFIFVFDLGVQGAALATILSQMVSAVWTFSFLTGNRTIVKIKYSQFRLERARVKKILALGLSGFTMQITNSIVQMVSNVNLHIYGGDIYIGAMTVINSIREVVMMPIQGITNSSQPIMSFNYGAKMYDRVKLVIKYMGIALLIFTFTAWGGITIFTRQLIMIFNHDPELIRVAVPSMHIYFFGFFMMAFQFIGQSTFTALGKSKNAVFFSIFRKVLIVTPLIYILPKTGFGVNGVFLAESISNFIGGAACFLTMYYTVYKKLDKDRAMCGKTADLIDTDVDK